MLKRIKLKGGKILEVPECTVVVKPDPTIDDSEHIDARIVINSWSGPVTDIPVVILLRAEDFEGDLHGLTASLVSGMDQYPDLEKVCAVRVITCGGTHYPGIRWLSA